MSPSEESDEWHYDQAFDYEAFVAREFPDHAEPGNWRPTPRTLILAFLALLCIGLILFGTLR